jgi:hypothetical protein
MIVYPEIVPVNVNACPGARLAGIENDIDLAAVATVNRATWDAVPEEDTTTVCWPNDIGAVAVVENAPPETVVTGLGAPPSIVYVSAGVVGKPVYEPDSVNVAPGIMR